MSDPSRPTHVLVVDDDRAVRRVVRHGLEREGFAVLEAGDGATALACADEVPLSVVILDLYLPDISGFEVLAQIRQRSPDAHVIMLTGAGSEADRVQGLISGADDYVVKPFSVRELAARVTGAQRRRAKTLPSLIEVGGLRIDTEARHVDLGGEPLDLTRREFDLLAHLAANRGRTFSRQELLEQVWGSSAEWQSPATITEHVRRLRQKVELDPDHPIRIVTVRGAGYRFDEPATDAEPSGPWAPAEVGDVPDDLTVVLEGTRVLNVTPAVVALVGATSESELVGADVRSFVTPSSVATVEARQHILGRGRSPRPDVMTIVRLDGERVVVEVASTPVRWHGRPAIQTTMWELGRVSARHVDPLGSDDAVIITDAELRIRSLNATAEELYGYATEDVLGRSVFDALPWVRDDLTAEAVRRAFHRDGRWEGEVVQGRDGGDRVAVHASVTLMRNGDGAPMGVIAVSQPRERTAPPSAAFRDGRMRRAIERGEFVVHYQPIVQLHTSRWVGFEALVRWNDPTRGLLAPDAFMGDAERSGLVVELGRFVLDEACRQWARWHAAGHDLRISVNLSARQLAAPGLVESVHDSIARAGMPAGQLWLEVTETELVDDLSAAAAMLEQLVEVGTRFAIDDFGTGWANLSYLSHLPVHGLKLDRTFVSGLGRNATDAAIVASVLRLASDLGLLVIAEGVETAAQLAQLLQLGCTLGQGYLFAEPRAPEALGLGEG